MVMTLLTTKDAARQARVAVSTILKYLHAGHLVLAKLGEHGQKYFHPLEVERWVAWYATHQVVVKKKRQSRAREMAQANGMLVAGKLPCEEADGIRRTRLFATACGADLGAAALALQDLYRDYNRLRLPLEEARLGINLGGSAHATE